MIAQLIADYLIDHRRLTVPGLGTFIVKNEEDSLLFGGQSGPTAPSIVFSELLNADDGALRSLVKERDHISDLEAIGKIDRFVFETRYALTRSGRCDISPLGVLTLLDGVISVDPAQAMHSSNASTPEVDLTQNDEPKRPAKQKKGRRMDLFTWIGIVVIIAAAGVVTYTFYEEPIRAFVSQWI